MVINLWSENLRGPVSLNRGSPMIYLLPVHIEYRFRTAVKTVQYITWRAVASKTIFLVICLPQKVKNHCSMSCRHDKYRDLINTILSRGLPPDMLTPSDISSKRTLNQPSSLNQFSLKIIFNNTGNNVQHTRLCGYVMAYIITGDSSNL